MMRCPHCWRRLQVVGQRRLETLIEHGLAPNTEPSLKNAWGCVAAHCPHAYDGSVWDDFGDAYQRGGDALFSWSWRYRIFLRRWFRYVRNPLIRFRLRFAARPEPGAGRKP